MNAPAPIVNLTAVITIPTLADGELYAGLVRENNAWHHLILLPAAEPEEAGWEKQMAWAKEQGGDLPSRPEQAVLFANLKYEFESDWYWSNTLPASDAGFAWMQHFASGHQDYDPQSLGYRARAVRRLIIR